MTVFIEPEGGGQGILDCRVESEPLANLTLHLRGQLVAASQPWGTPAQPHIRVSASPNALRLDMETLNPSDEGEYMCSASNELGTTTAKAYFGTRGEGWLFPGSQGPIPGRRLPRSFLRQPAGCLMQSYVGWCHLGRPCRA